jgi:hypothetical protein
MIAWSKPVEKSSAAVIMRSRNASARSWRIWSQVPRKPPPKPLTIATMSVSREITHRFSRRRYQQRGLSDTRRLLLGDEDDAVEAGPDLAWASALEVHLPVDPTTIVPTVVGRCSPRR